MAVAGIVAAVAVVVAAVTAGKFPPSLNSPQQSS